MAAVFYRGLDATCFFFLPKKVYFVLLVMTYSIHILGISSGNLLTGLQDHLTSNPFSLEILLVDYSDWVTSNEDARLGLCQYLRSNISPQCDRILSYGRVQFTGTCALLSEVLRSSRLEYMLICKIDLVGYPFDPIEICI